MLFVRLPMETILILFWRRWPKRYSSPQGFTRVTIAPPHIYKALGLDILSGTVLFAAMLRDKIVESRFSSYLIESKDLGVIEIESKGAWSVNRGKCKCSGRIHSRGDKEFIRGTNSGITYRCKR